MRKRAKKGGETGQNGEWYDGGKFIATTNRPKGKPAQIKVSRKEQYEPYKWAVAPEAGQRAIFGFIGNILSPIREPGQRNWTQVSVNHDYFAYMQRTHETTDFWGYAPDELAAMWNSGTRWIMPK